MFIWWRIVQK